MFKKYFFLFTFLVVFTFIHCSAKESLKKKNSNGDSLQNFLKKNEDKLVDLSNIEELKKSALVVTFNDIKSMTDEEISDFIVPAGVLWFKDFYNWKLDQLNEEILSSIMLQIEYSRYLSSEDINSVVIDGKKILKHISFQQAKSLNHELLRTFTNLTSIRIDIYPPESIAQLSNKQLEAVMYGLTTEQVLALDNKQIFYAGLNVRNRHRGELHPEVIPRLSVERLKSFGKDIFRLPIHLFNKEQFQVLNMDEVLNSERERDLRFSTNYLSPEQFSWLTLEQIPLLNTRLMAKKGKLKYLSEEQLKAFTKEQIKVMGRRALRLFSRDQIRFLIDYGTSNETMRYFIYNIDNGTESFKRLTWGLFGDGILPIWLGSILHYLDPEQLKDIPSEQLVYALVISSYIPNLSPEHIYNMPYFVESIRLEHILENAKLSWAVETRFLRERFQDMYKNNSIINLLDDDQIRGIHPNQIPKMNRYQLEVILQQKRNSRGLLIFTPEQFNALTNEQWNMLLSQSSRIQRYVSEEQWEALSLSQVEHLLEKVVWPEAKEKLLARRNYLLEFGDVKLLPKDSPPQPLSKKRYNVESKNYNRIDRSVSERVGGICVPRYKAEKERTVQPNIGKFYAMDDLDIAIAQNINENPSDQWDLFEGYLYHRFDNLPDKFQESCYQTSCLRRVFEAKTTAYRNYEACLKEYNPEME